MKLSEIMVQSCFPSTYGMARSRARYNCKLLALQLAIIFMYFFSAGVHYFREGAERSGTERNGKERNGKERNGTEQNSFVANVVS